MGDFDVESMHVVGRLLAFVYFLAFMGFSLLILMNLLIAMLMDVYSGVKDGLNGTSTLFQQASDILYRAYQDRKGLRIPLSAIDKCIMDHYGDTVFESEDVLTAPVFLELVPGLSQDQASHILVRACDHARIDKDGPDIADVFDMVSNLERRLLAANDDGKLKMAVINEDQHHTAPLHSLVADGSSSSSSDI